MPKKRPQRRAGSTERRAKSWVDRLIIPLLISTILAVAGSALKSHTDQALMRQELTTVHVSLDSITAQVAKQNEEFGRAISVLDDRYRRQHPGSGQ